jgi:hypothetical protein
MVAVEYIKLFWVVSWIFDKRNILPKSGTFLLGHPAYTYIYIYIYIYIFCMKD